MGYSFLKMVSGVSYIPKDNKLKPRGEDAHFICLEKDTIGVADGVGGWAKMGVDAGKYARQLMKNSVAALRKERKGDVDPIKVLDDAFWKTNAAGSSTACIVTLKDCLLHAANVGDSGFMLFRNNRLIYKSPVQQRSFNFPYQLGNNKESDRPRSAQELKVIVKAGDIIVLGTDGLLDNLFGSQIESILNQATKEQAQPVPLARMIAEHALYNSFDKHAITPFATAAQRAGKHHEGGKVDDITVIVTRIIMC